MKTLKRILILLLIGILMISNLVAFSGCNKYKNKEVEALVHTAKAYLQRGVAIQYDMGPFKGTSEERRNMNKKQPEEYGYQNADFLDCSSFAWGVYMSALDYDIKYDSTKGLMQANDDVKVFDCHITGNETDEQKKTIAKDYLNTLEIGDLIVFRRASSGHVMLYVGEDKDLPEGHDIIHSTGNSYDHYEENGTIQSMSTSDLFVESRESSYYAFNDKFVWIGIVRPFNNYDKYNEPLPENTVNRVNNLYKTTASKTCSVCYGGTVSLGGELTYTFTIKNSNDKSVTLAVSDTVPTNTSFVSSSNGGVNNNGNLSWNVEIPAGETREVSYTVKVNNDVSLIGKTIYTDTAKIGGVKFTCQKVYVGNTLTSDQMQIIKTNIENVKTTELRGVDALNYIYTGVSNVDFIGTTADFVNDVMLKEALNVNEKYYEMLAPCMYLGNLYTQKSFCSGERAKIILPHYLLTGDVVVLRNIDDNTERVYVFNGEKLVNVTSADIEVVDDTFEILQLPTAKDINVTLAVLRPSLSLA